MGKESRLLGKLENQAKSGYYGQLRDYFCLFSLHLLIYFAILYENDISWINGSSATAIQQREMRDNAE